MPDRESLRRDFLDISGWSEAERMDLAGDASNRRYFRLMLEGTPAVLMDAPPEKGEDVRPFIKIAQVLRSAGLSAPEIMAEDRENGFLLLEDLGDDLFARVLTKDPAMEEQLYQAATDVLITLHNAPIDKNLAPYDGPMMADLARLAFDWYATVISGQDLSDVRSKFVAGFQEAVGHLTDMTDVLIQRDYHAENLLWRPDRDGVARVGLLDFQDAMAGHRSYDLVSLLQDARRDVSPAIEAQMIDYYIKATGLDPSEFKSAYALMGLQRNLRIIGVFARLCLRDGKSHYVDLIPRVWAHMLRDLKSVNFTYLETVLTDYLPHPDASSLKVLKSKCGTIPHPP
ncbi:MAG: phosphotransferase [Pseudomonadota bacterium]